MSLDLPAADGPTNMAADAALLSLARQSGCHHRVYLWEGPWVSLGQFQNPHEAVVAGFQNWLQRPTGGKAVLHGHDVTVAIAIPFEGRTVKEAYRRTATPIVEALRTCGLPASFSISQSNSLQADCFASSSPYDVIHEQTGQKVAGCAMRVAQGALLLQASVPYKAPLVDPATAIVGAVATKIEEWDSESFPKALREALRSL
ncbi:MAG TPA: hypothetical protein VG944_16540 [Fimbriimonas sp.]|nr:hypothetical protein [Fimbriimonas sp.]